MENIIYLYKMMSLGFAYPDENGWKFLEEFLPKSDLIFKGALPRKLGELREYFITHRPSLEEMQMEYLSFFDMGAKVIPYETEYVQEKISRKPRLLADIAGFYKAFGFEAASDAKNRESIDHISVELEFMVLLYMKMLQAMEQGFEDRVQVVEDAIRKFLEDHLAGWGFLYCSLIQESDGHEFYKKLAGLLRAFLQDELTKYGMDPGPLQRGLFNPCQGSTGWEDFTCGPVPPL
ncbi:MAG: molecular chaperone TorD family protein [bacterium]